MGSLYIKAVLLTLEIFSVTVYEFTFFSFRSPRSKLWFKLLFLFSGNDKVRGKLDGPLLHMLNELRKEVSGQTLVLSGCLESIAFFNSGLQFPLPTQYNAERQVKLWIHVFNVVFWVGVVDYTKAPQMKTFPCSFVHDCMGPEVVISGVSGIQQ